MRYEAPLLYDPESDHIIPDSYIVRLAPGYTLEQHAATINIKTAVFVHHIYTFIEEQVYYIARPIDKHLLEVIRSDPNVEDVRCEPDVVLID